MTFRFPDKPATQVHREAIVPGAFDGYFATLKMNGWRTLITVTESGPFVYTSRENRPIPISPECRDRFESDLRALDVPPGTVFDAEWVCRRPGAREEAVWLFDILRLGDLEYRLKPAMFRFQLLQNCLGFSRTGDRWGDHAALYVVPAKELSADFGPFYDRHKHRTDAEGIVLKQNYSPWIGSLRACAPNPGWVKCKWLEGDSGTSAK